MINCPTRHEHLGDVDLSMRTLELYDAYRQSLREEIRRRHGDALGLSGEPASQERLQEAYAKYLAGVVAASAIDSTGVDLLSPQVRRLAIQASRLRAASAELAAFTLESLEALRDVVAVGAFIS